MRRTGPGWATLAGAGTALCWVLTCLRWFDDGALWRPAWLTGVPSWVPGLLAAVLGTSWVWQRRTALLDPGAHGDHGGVFFGMMAFFFRLPLAWWGAAGYVTPDGSLSGIVALRLREGGSRLVFVPQVPYSGSLKSHLAAALSWVVEMPRAFALVSILFYALFVAAVYRLARLARLDPRSAAAAALYAVFAPAFVTRYSLSNDGNYVEVLALGAWALVLLARALQAPEEGRPAAARWIVAGLLLGLAQWSHLLATIHLLAAALVLATVPALLPRALLPLGGGFLFGYLPGLLWNAAHGWESLQYVIPGGPAVGGAAHPGLLASARSMVATQWPVLLGYDPGYGGVADVLLRGAAWIAVSVAALATIGAVREAWRGGTTLRLLVLLTVANLALAWLALPAIEGNPRYLIFLMTPLPIFLARALTRGWRRWIMAGLLVLGLVGSWAQAPGAFRADAQWRSFVATLEKEGVRHCYTDFFLAAKVNFLSSERVVCAAKLGPTTTEYFFDYRERVERAPEAALVAVNPTAADKLERRLNRLGVSYERRDLMKPVLLRLSRKVDPEELFPGREFPLR